MKTESWGRVFADIVLGCCAAGILGTGVFWVLAWFGPQGPFLSQPTRAVQFLPLAGERPFSDPWFVSHIDYCDRTAGYNGHGYCRVEGVYLKGWWCPVMDADEYTVIVHETPHYIDAQRKTSTSNGLNHEGPAGEPEWVGLAKGRFHYMTGRPTYVFPGPIARRAMEENRFEDLKSYRVNIVFRPAKERGLDLALVAKLEVCNDSGRVLHTYVEE